MPTDRPTNDLPTNDWPRFTVFVGDTGVGKTSMLRSLAFTHSGSATSFYPWSFHTASGRREADLRTLCRGHVTAMDSAVRRVLTTIRRLDVMQDGFPQYAVDVGTCWLVGPQISAGTCRVLDVLMLAQHQKLLVIDDIDQGLDVRAQQRLIDELRQVQLRRPELQILCTTHSPYMLDAFEPGEVHILTRASPGPLTTLTPRRAQQEPLVTCTALVDHPEYPRWAQGMRPGEIWINLNT